MNQRRIAIISDTHGHIAADIIKIIESCDMVIHAGDICGAHVLTQLKNINHKVIAVTGNNDTPELWDDTESHIVSKLPAIAELELPGGTLAVEHGHQHGMHQPDHASLRESHPYARVIVYGHTHTMLVDDEHTPIVVNPGAAGATRTRGGPSCLILTASSDTNWDIKMMRFEDEDAA